MLLHCVISVTDRAMAKSSPSVKDTRFLLYSFISVCCTQAVGRKKVNESEATSDDDEGTDQELL